MLVYFLLRDDKNTTKKFKLNDDEYVTIGRSDKSIIKISDELTSGVHCKIYLKDNKIIVEDIGSKNGTFINGVKITEQRFYLDDVLKIGKSFVTIDISQLDSSDKKKLVCSEPRMGVNRELSLSLESYNETKAKISAGKSGHLVTKKQKEFVEKSKLFANSLDHLNQIKNIGNESDYDKAAYLDNFFSVLVFLFIFNTARIIDPLLWSRFNLSFEYIFNDFFVYTIASLVGSAGFHIYNKRQKKGSFGEQIFKL